MGRGILEKWRETEEEKTSKKGLGIQSSVSKKAKNRGVNLAFYNRLQILSSSFS